MFHGNHCELTQSISCVVAVLVALPTLALARATFHDQRNLAQSQVEINRADQERQERRFASRVAWWHLSYGEREQLQLSSDDIALRLQNRSPSPLTDIVFELGLLTEGGSQSDTYVTFSTTTRVPPCAILTFKIDRGPLRAFGTVRLVFTDAAGTWRVGDGKPERAAADPFEESMSSLEAEHALELEDTRREASDCGESG